METSSSSSFVSPSSPLRKRIATAKMMTMKWQPSAQCRRQQHSISRLSSPAPAPASATWCCQRPNNNTKNPLIKISSSLVLNSCNHSYYHHHKKNKITRPRRRREGVVLTGVYRYFDSLNYNTSSVLSITSNTNISAVDVLRVVGKLSRKQQKSHHRAASEKSASTAKLHDFCLGIPYSFVFVIVSLLASITNFYACAWVPVHPRWMCIPIAMLMMNTLWIDCVAAIGQLCINILALRRWKKDNSTIPESQSSSSQLRNTMDDSAKTMPIVVDVEDRNYTQNTNRFVISPYTVVSLCAAVVLTLRSILRFHLYRIISAPSSSHGANLGRMGFIWLGGGIVMHLFMSIFFMYNIAAGGNPQKKDQVKVVE